MPRQVLQLGCLGLCGCIAASVFCGQSDAAGEVLAQPSTCRPLQITEQQKDYRFKDSTPKLQWAYQDNWTHHMSEAVRLIQEGNYGRQVIYQLDWTLFRWPNHYEAIQALIRYDLAGGKTYEFEKAACYLQRAHQFAPDDLNVMLAEGYYFWKKGDRDRAMQSYASALSTNPDSADAHYNLGLLYLELSDYDKAREHAVAAYAAGHPLPGLRRKLEAAGHWSELPPTE